MKKVMLYSNITSHVIYAIKVLYTNFTYLQTKLVEKIVSKISEAGQNAVVQIMMCHTLEYDAAVCCFKAILKTVMQLVAMDSHIKHKEA